jgi:hypothetical protein
MALDDKNSELPRVINISQVRYTPDRKFIESVKATTDTENKLTTYSRNYIRPFL